MTNAEIIAAADRYLFPTYARAPLALVRGEGTRVWDADGRVYLDFFSSTVVTNLGHRHPAIVRAITEQAERILHVSNLHYCEPQARLAEKLVKRSFAERVFLCNSGAEANEAALKLARYYSKRVNVIAFLGSFHGRTMGSLAATSSRFVQRRGFGPMMPGMFHAPYATCYRCPVGLRPETCQAECLGYLEDQILVHLVSPDEVAAVLVEPIQGEGGYVVPAPQFHQRLRALTKTHGMLLIADEVQSGMGRTGRMFACEHEGVVPAVAVNLAVALSQGMRTMAEEAIQLVEQDVTTIGEILRRVYVT
jgi:4-aminobutyrate aminotransferase